MDKWDVDVLIAKIEQGLDEVTSGPWTPSWACDRLSSEENPFYRFEARGPQVGAARRDTPYYDQLSKRMFRDAEHIALCSPENVRALIHRIRSLEDARTETAQERPIATETNVNEQRT